VTRTPRARDLVLRPAGAVHDPDADPALPPLAADVEAVERADQPLLEAVDIGADVARADVPCGRVRSSIT
jgi:hypothetical protein